MASGRVFLGLACLAAAGGADAAPVAPARLTLSLRGLEPAMEVSYHPYRWLTIRRSVAFFRSEPVDDVRAAGQTPLPKSRMQALTGAVHPFGDAFRLSFGVREDDNRRLLRGSDAASAVGTAQYAPIVAVGFAEAVGDGLTIAADIGMLGRSRFGPQGGLLVTPIELMQRWRDEGRGYRPMLHLSAGYRF